MTIKSDQLIDASVDVVQARTWITKSNKHAPRAKAETATFLREPNHVPCNPKRKWRAHAGSRLKPPTIGKARLESLPSSRTGENPPYVAPG